MMSAAVSTSRATSRTSKDKSKSTAHQTQTKSDGPPSKVQPTEEQMRIAQITSGQDDTELAAIYQLMEMTGKSEDTVAVALHDCENDLERAALMLLEGQTDEPQGEWKVEQSKKKKRTNNQSVPIPKTEPVSNHTSDKSDNKRDRSRGDDDRPDNKHDGPPRRGRRNGPPPRLARGRGRDRNNQFGDRNADGDNDGYKRDGYGDRGGFRDRGGQEGDGFKDQDSFRDQDGFRDRENGYGGFGRERSGDRGRGRGRGGNRFSGRGGRGRGGGGFKTEGRPQRFDKGPQIDTWTNETAVNADKEPAGWGETWESTAPATEDWNDDTWQGSLTDTQVFTASTVKEEPMAPTPLNDITSSMGQSNSLGQSGSMTGSIGQQSSMRQPGSIGSSNSLQSSTLGQRLDLSSLLKTAEQQQQQANDTLIAQYNQQATESIKNTIGIGSSSRGNISNLQSQSSASGMNYSQSLQQSSGMPPNSLAAQMSSSQPPHVQQALQQQQQRPKPQRSKLPPPSKIPASAVEMPGHVMPQLDVQFGVDFGADSSPFSFGSSESSVTAGGYTSTTQTRQGIMLQQATKSENNPSLSSVSMGNHLSQVSKSESVMSAGMMSSPGKQPPMAGMEQVSPRTSVFQSTPYNTTPPKKEAPSPLSQPTKMTPPDPIPFPPSQSDRKSSPLMGGQRPGQAASSLAQGSLSTGKTDSGLSSFVQSGSYQSSSYQGHKPSGLSSTQAYTHPTSTQGNSFPPQYQASQNQYQSGQNQYSTGSNQFQSGSNQYPSYQSGSASFQSQSNYSSGQANQNSLYPSATQTSSYQAAQQASSSYIRDSQASSARQSSTNSTNAYPNQASNLSSPPSQTQSASSVSGYNTKTYNSSGHQSSLQTSPLTGNKLGDSLSNMSIKDSMTDSHQSSQFDHSATSTTAASLPTTTSSTSLSSATSTIASTTVSSVVSGSTRTSLPSSSKAPPNLPPGVPLVGHQYIVGQSAIPPFYVSNPSQQNIQQPALYPGYEDLQLLQQRLPVAANSYYDMSGFPVPSTIGGQDRATLGSVPYSAAGTTDSSKLNRVDAQSPNPTSQQQSTQSAHHPFINLQYGYYYNPMLTGAAPGFQYPTMFPMPPVTNTAHAGTTATTQFQKYNASHGYNTAKAYDDLTQAQDFTKTGYGATQTQSKGTAGTRAGTGADLASSAYNKTHTQAFDKQGFHAGTPPPFNLPMATQAGAMGAPTTPYGAAPFVPMMPHQPHSQMLHHPLQQDSTGGSARGQQATSQAKAGTKPYTTYWGSN